MTWLVKPRVSQATNRAGVRRHGCRVRNIACICPTKAVKVHQDWVDVAGGGLVAAAVVAAWRAGGRGGGGASWVVVVVFSQDKASFCGADHRLQRAWTGFNNASWSSTAWRGSGGDPPRSRTASLGTWTLFPRARCCDTLPTCHATVYGDFWETFLRIST